MKEIIGIIVVLALYINIREKSALILSLTEKRSTTPKMKCQTTPDPQIPWQNLI
jgi:hypothetical protein